VTAPHNDLAARLAEAEAEIAAIRGFPEGAAGLDPRWVADRTIAGDVVWRLPLGGPGYASGDGAEIECQHGMAAEAIVRLGGEVVSDEPLFAYVDYADPPSAAAVTPIRDVMRAAERLLRSVPVS
jgi:hypothetical protein